MASELEFSGEDVEPQPQEGVLGQDGYSWVEVPGAVVMDEGPVGGGSGCSGRQLADTDGWQGCREDRRKPRCWKNRPGAQLEEQPGGTEALGRGDIGGLVYRVS